MSVDRALKEMIRDEVERLISPLSEAIEELRSGGNVASQIAALLSGKKRGPGRPKGSGRGPGRPKGSRNKSSDQKGCAIKGCKKAMRSKGYCSAHYQKYRMLERTHRLPSDWKEYASEGSVKDLKLPRGRAGAKALAALKARG